MSESLEAAPGDVVSETEHATTYQGATATTFEGENSKKQGTGHTRPVNNLIPQTPPMSDCVHVVVLLGIEQQSLRYTVAANCDEPSSYMKQMLNCCSHIHPISQSGDIYPAQSAGEFQAIIVPTFRFSFRLFSAVRSCVK